VVYYRVIKIKQSWKWPMIFEGKVEEVYKVSASPTPSEKLFLIVLHFSIHSWNGKNITRF
jgi:hypothetical protein